MGFPRPDPEQVAASSAFDQVAASVTNEDAISLVR